MKKYKNGFTLAEVLITLVIIGIIAAMTIPTLMNKTNEQETVVAVKKAYSVLGQAYQRMFADYGEINPSFFGSTVGEATKNFGDIFIKYLNVQKVCGVSVDGDCFIKENGGMYKYLDGSDYYNYNEANEYYKMVLNDGSLLAINNQGKYVSRGSTEALESVFAIAMVDINGHKAPNMMGRDVFMFWISKYGVLPWGSPYDLNINEKYPSTIDTCASKGRGCTAWVITKGNMDYLRKDVSW